MAARTRELLRITRTRKNGGLSRKKRKMRVGLEPVSTGMKESVVPVSRRKLSILG